MGLFNMIVHDRPREYMSECKDAMISPITTRYCH